MSKTLKARLRLKQMSLSWGGLQHLVLLGCPRCYAGHSLRIPGGGGGAGLGLWTTDPPTHIRKGVLREGNPSLPAHHCTRLSAALDVEAELQALALIRTQCDGME